jgi:hypothetical protein
LKLSQEEQLAFDKIKAISRKDPKILKDVFISLLQMVTLETYNNNDNNFIFYIPYLCGIKVDYCDKIKYTAEGNKKGQYIDFNITIIPSESFISEVDSINTGDTSPSLKYIKKQIVLKTASLMDIHEVEIEE